MQFKAGLYIRLSKEDKNDSIKNQKNLLINYANNLNYEIKKIYVDDGYTGTNFNRPAFNSLLKDIKNKDNSSNNQNIKESLKYLDLNELPGLINNNSFENVYITVLSKDELDNELIEIVKNIKQQSTYWYSYMFAA